MAEMLRGSQSEDQRSAALNHLDDFRWAAHRRDPPSCQERLVFEVVHQAFLSSERCKIPQTGFFVKCMVYSFTRFSFLKSLYIEQKTG